MNDLTLGIDTSNYKTSVAVTDPEGGTVFSAFGISEGRTGRERTASVGGLFSSFSGSAFIY